MQARSGAGLFSAPVKPTGVLTNGMQAHNALHSSNRRRRNSFDSVECPAPGALSSSAAAAAARLHAPLPPTLPPASCLPLLMLSIWRFMQKCAAASRPPPPPPPSPPSLSAGTPACHKLSFAKDSRAQAAAGLTT